MGWTDDHLHLLVIRQAILGKPAKALCNFHGGNRADAGCIRSAPRQLQA